MTRRGGGGFSSREFIALPLRIKRAGYVSRIRNKFATERMRDEDMRHACHTPSTLATFRSAQFSDERAAGIFARTRFRSQDVAISNKNVANPVPSAGISSEARYSAAQKSNVRGCKYFRRTHYLFIFSSGLYKTQFRCRSRARRLARTAPRVSPLYKTAENRPLVAAAKIILSRKSAGRPSCARNLGNLVQLSSQSLNFKVESRCPLMRRPDTR